MLFDAQRTPTGFTLDVGLPGHAFAAPLLASLGLGYAQSAISFSGDHERVFGLSSEPLGDHVLIVGRISTSNPNLTRAPSTSPDRPPLRSRTPVRLRPSLAMRVDQILSGQSSQAPQPPQATKSSMTRERAAEPAASDGEPGAENGSDTASGKRHRSTSG